MIDTYTKAILTVIAVCLVYQVGKDVISPANAQQRMDVNIVGIAGNMFSGIGISPIHPALPVKVVQ